VGSRQRNDDVGATLVVALLPDTTNGAATRGRPYKQAMCHDTAWVAAPTDAID